MKKNKKNNMSILAMMIALAIIFSILEGFLPQPVPGVKLGLANLISIIVLVRFGIKDMWVVVITRVALTSLLTGTIMNFGFYFALSGSLVSLTIASLLFRSKLVSIYSISALMAIGHVIGQIIVVCILYNTWGMLFYLPVTLAFAYPAGLMIAVVANQVDERLVI